MLILIGDARAARARCPQGWYKEGVLGEGALCSQQVWSKEDPSGDLLTGLTDLFKLAVVFMPFCNPSKSSPLEG